jgi:hypothetical protein
MRCVDISCKVALLSKLCALSLLEDVLVCHLLTHQGSLEAMLRTRTCWDSGVDTGTTLREYWTRFRTSNHLYSVKTEHATEVRKIKIQTKHFP